MKKGAFWKIVLIIALVLLLGFLLWMYLGDRFALSPPIGEDDTYKPKIICSPGNRCNNNGVIICKDSKTACECSENLWRLIPCATTQVCVSGKGCKASQTPQ